MKWGASIALLLCLSALVHAVQQIEDAAAFNTALAQGMLNLNENQCGFPERQPTEENIFSVAGIRAVSLMPQVDNTTSDRRNVTLLWSIAAKYPETATFSSPASQGCPGFLNTLYIYNPGMLKFNDGNLKYAYGNSVMNVPLALTGPNPVQLLLDGSSLRDSDFETLFANLSANLSGRFSIDYTFRKTVWRVVCRPVIGGNGEVGGTVCGCESDTTGGTRTFATYVADNRNFSVETGPVSEFWVNPPLEKRLEGSQYGELIFFARRMPSEIIAAVDGKNLGGNAPYKYDVSTGVCGEQEVTSIFSPEGKNMVVNSSNQTYHPFQLVGKNASYLPFYVLFSWNETPGRKKMLLSFEDRFGFTENFTRNFSVRAPTPFVPSSDSGANEMAIRKGSDTETPAAYPMPASGGTSPSLVPLAIVFALPVVLGAIAFIRQIGRHHDK